MVAVLSWGVFLLRIFNTPNQQAGFVSIEYHLSHIFSLESSRDDDFTLRQKYRSEPFVCGRRCGEGRGEVEGIAKIEGFCVKHHNLILRRWGLHGYKLYRPKIILTKSKFRTVGRRWFRDSLWSSKPHWGFDFFLLLCWIKLVHKNCPQHCECTTVAWLPCFYRFLTDLLVLHTVVRLFSCMHCHLSWHASFPVS